MHVPSVASLRAVAEVHLLTTLSTFQSHTLGEHMRLSELAAKTMSGKTLIITFQGMQLTQHMCTCIHTHDV